MDARGEPSICIYPRMKRRVHLSQIRPRPQTPRQWWCRSSWSLSFLPYLASAPSFGAGESWLMSNTSRALHKVSFMTTHNHPRFKQLSMILGSTTRGKQWRTSEVRWPIYKKWIKSRRRPRKKTYIIMCTMCPMWQMTDHQLPGEATGRPHGGRARSGTSRGVYTQIYYRLWYIYWD